MKKIGYLGPPGTFSELATIFYLDKIVSSSNKEKFETVCFNSFAEIMSAVEAGGLDEGILPLENSTEGPVNQTLDLLAHRYKRIKIKAEVVLPVIPQLLVRPGIKLDGIKVVVSHPQPLAQCRGFIDHFLPEVEVKEVSSTAEAARIVAQGTVPWAAIGTEAVAQLYGLDVLAENINDYPDNATRFVVVSLEDSSPVPECKTSIILSVKDRPGALFDILKEFAQRGINLTRIESRPAKSRLGDYLFFIDMIGHREDQIVGQALSAIQEYTIHMRILGSYPAHGLAGQGTLNNPPVLGNLRGEIDRIDAGILRLLGQRARIVEQVGKLKMSTDKVRDYKREGEILRRVRSLARKEGIDEQIVENIYLLLLDYFVSLQIDAIRINPSGDSVLPSGQ